MELEFQKQTSLTTKQREKSRTTNKKTKFVGVRQRPSGKWVAEIKNTTQKIRMWLGTFDTAEEAARAYDEAACLLRGTNTRTNFVDNIPPTSALSMKIRNLLNKKQSIKLSATEKEASQNSTTTKMTSFNCSASTSPVVCSLSDDMQSFDDAYKPDFCHFSGGNEMGNLHFDYSSLDFDVMASGFDGIFSNQENGFEVPKNCGEISQMMIPEYFDKMTVERQISASLYALNGVNEYWDNVDACGGNDAFWDLPMLSSNVVPNVLSKLTPL